MRKVFFSFFLALLPLCACIQADTVYVVPFARSYLGNIRLCRFSYFGTPLSLIPQREVFEWESIQSALQSKGHTVKITDLSDVSIADLMKAKKLFFLDIPKWTGPQWRQLLRILPREKLVLIAAEPPTYLPEMYTEELLSLFGRVYTWNDALVDNKKFFKFNYAALLPMRRDIPSFSKKKFLTLVAGNKTSSHPDELYSERLQAIRYFEAQLGSDFEFYGTGWEGAGFRNYRGKLEDKNLILKNYRFCICYENIKNVKGYITEKILDCLSAGCIPIYWGASNVKEYIPENCFIDREKFATFDHLIAYLRNMGDREYNHYLAHIAEFLKSEKAKLFSREVFVQKITKCVLETKNRGAEYAFKKPCLVVTPLKYNFIAEFYMVLGCLDFYERMNCSGMMVDFGNEGLYYDRNQGSNFWNYYFKPIAIGAKNKGRAVHFTHSEREGFFDFSRYHMEEARLQELVKKYVHVQPALQKKADRFCKNKFKGHFIIGVDYRCTTKNNEALLLSYKNIHKEILRIAKTLKQKKNRKVKIFVVADEELTKTKPGTRPGLVAYLEDAFPGQILVSSLQSPIAPNKIGEKVVVDCALFSKCHFLLRVDSDLSMVATLLNSHGIPLKDLSIHNK